MNKLDDIYMKIDTIETCFHAMEKFIDDATKERTQEATNRLENFFYLLWDQLKEAKEETLEASKAHSKETAKIIKRLESENKN